MLYLIKLLRRPKCTVYKDLEVCHRQFISCAVTLKENYKIELLFSQVKNTLKFTIQIIIAFAHFQIV